MDSLHALVGQRPPRRRQRLPIIPMTRPANSIVHFMGYGHTACMRTGPPATWPDDHFWSADWNEITCPDCIKGRDYMDTFTISADNLSITCKRCGHTSRHPKDVEYHYCGW